MLSRILYEGGIDMEKEQFHCDEARAFHLDDFCQVSQCCVITVCIHCYLLVMEVLEENALYVSKCYQEHLFY
jgi:hypothetical protein